MKILDVNFRDLDRKWIAIERWKDIKHINKSLKSDLNDALVLAFLFIDNEKGITARIVGNIEYVNKVLNIDNSFLNKEYYIYSNILQKTKFEIIEDSVIKNIKNLDVIEEDISSKFYNKQSILDSRKIKDIDQYRGEYSPDDLELYFENKNESELIWGKIQVYSKEREVFACKLLQDSEIDKDYKKDSFVFAKIIKNKKDVDVVIDGLANVKNKEN